MMTFVDKPQLELYDKKIIDQLKKRQLLNVISLKSYKVEKGPNFSVERKKLETDLTAEMLRTGTWKDASFKKYNF